MMMVSKMELNFGSRNGICDAYRIRQDWLFCLIASNVEIQMGSYFMDSLLELQIWR